jgi:xylulokinase
MSKYLGLDLSTQSFSAIIVDDQTGETVHEESVNFGNDLPGYNAPSGFVHGENEGEVFSDPCMWLDALDLLLKKLQDKTDLSSIRAIAGSGQQHATVYLNPTFLDKVTALNPASSLSENLKSTLSRNVSPIWMDNSTSAECTEIAASVGSPEVVLSKSGSIPIERFSGAQIRKFFKTDKAAYDKTAIIHLASSFACSILSGKSSVIDLGDGAGMNLLNLQNNDWDKELLEACAPSLKEKLPAAAASNSFTGHVSSYFVDKYGFSADTEVYAFSGDNPNSLIGCGGALPGTAVISLGTSDTFFAAMSKPITDPNGFGHVFGNPAGGFMSLICFRNGSLTREKLKDQFNLDWEDFSKALNSTTTTIQLPWLIDELTPRVPVCKKSVATMENAVVPSIIRQFIEGQFINMFIHSEWMGEKINHIILTGGASQNNKIAQIIADVFDAKIERLEVANSAALGAAMRACQAASNKDWLEINKLFIKTDDAKAITANVYDRENKLHQFKALLSEHLKQ